MRDAPPVVVVWKPEPFTPVPESDPHGRLIYVTLEDYMEKFGYARLEISDATTEGAINKIPVQLCFFPRLFPFIFACFDQKYGTRTAGHFFLRFLDLQ